MNESNGIAGRSEHCPSVLEGRGGAVTGISIEVNTGKHAK